MTTLVAAFIGAIVGSIGSIYVEERLRKKRELREQQDALVRGFVFPLQDAVEALWHRLYNIGYEGGSGAMSAEYRRTTTVYALARVLAAERILNVEGLAPILRRPEFYPELAKTLTERKLSRELSIPGLQQYDRIALAEAVLERDEHGIRPSTYLAFRERFGASEQGSSGWLVSAAAAVDDLDRRRIDKMLDLLGRIAHEAAKATELVPSILEKEQKLEAQRAASRAAANS